MSIPADSYNKLQYNVHALSDDIKVLDQWPELKQIEIFTRVPLKIADPKDKDKTITVVPYGGLDPDKVLRYIFLMYDRNSPIVRNISNLINQKSESARISGFRKEGDLWPTKVLQLFNCAFEDVNLAILSFSRMQKSTEWQLYVVLTTKHYQDQQAIMNREDKAPSTKDMLSDAGEIDQLRLSLLNDDTNENLAEAVEDYNLEQFSLRVEEIGVKISNGDAVVDIRPYE
jgi:hypothetical protein